MVKTDVCVDTVHEPQAPTPDELAAWNQQTLQGYMDNYGVSFEEAVRRFAVADEVETLFDTLLTDHPDLLDVYWLEHEPDFRAVIRVSRGVTIDEMCARVADWPMVVAVESGATTTYADLERGYEILSDMVMAGDLSFWEVALDTRSNSILVRGPERPSDAYLAELSERAGVPVRFELMSEDERSSLLRNQPSDSPEPMSP